MFLLSQLALTGLPAVFPGCSCHRLGSQRWQLALPVGRRHPLFLRARGAGSTARGLGPFTVLSWGLVRFAWGGADVTCLCLGPRWKCELMLGCSRSVDTRGGRPFFCSLQKTRGHPSRSQCGHMSTRVGLGLTLVTTHSPACLPLSVGQLSPLWGSRIPTPALG